MNINKLALLASVAACMGALPPSLATAQPAAADQAVGLEEVVVTAQRREERLQDVPISVTALTSEALEEKQITDVMGLGKVTPGLQIRTTTSPVEVTTAIRGITMLLPLVTNDPPIGIYLDGVYNGITAGTNASMIDMERVEVLKGPQGTLFGRNTIGGAISITTASPTDEFEGYGKVEIGNYEARTFTGVVNVPIAPGKLDTRLVYQYTEHDGYGTNRVLNQPNGTFQQAFVRGSLKAKIADDWEVLLSGAYTRASGHVQGTRLMAFIPTASIIPGVLPPTNEFIPAISGNPGDLLTNYVDRGSWWDTYNDNLDTFYLKNYRFTGTITGKLNDAIAVKSITGYSNTRHNAATDFDGTPYVLVSQLDFAARQHQFSEELQFYGDAMDNRLTWIAGAYYFSQKATLLNHIDAFPALTQLFSPGAPHTINVTGSAPLKAQSYAAFAQVTYEILPDVRLTGGIRYAKDVRELVYDGHSEVLATGAYTGCLLANVPAAPTLAACTFSDKVKYDYWPWMIGVDYKPSDDILLYAKLSKGYRSGAWPQQGPAVAAGNPAQTAANLAAFTAVAPESLLSPEIGAKMEFLNKRLRVNVAGYYSDYRNIQLNILLPAPCAACGPIDSLQNSGRAHMWGGELEVTALIGDLRLDGSIGVLDPKYVSGARVGLGLINVSKTNFNLGASYPVRMQAGTLTFNANYAWRSKFVTFAYDLTTPAPLLDAVTQSGYGTVDGQITFELSNMPVTLSIYGQNLANKKSFINGPVINAWAVIYPNPPRTYGAALKYVF